MSRPHDPFAPADTGSEQPADNDEQQGGAHLESMSRSELAALAGTLGVKTDGGRETLLRRVRAAHRQRPTG